MPKAVHLNADGTKPCSICGEIKSANVFYLNGDTKSGRSSACIECNRKREYKRYRDHTAKRKAQAKWGALKFNFGLTKQQWETLLASQNYSCAICSMPLVAAGPIATPNACVDHDHATGRVRGLLCRQCNQGLGQFKDRSDIAQKAVDYLKRHGK
jgi:hypothetical protein